MGTTIGDYIGTTIGIHSPIREFPKIGDPNIVP